MITIYISRVPLQSFLKFLINKTEKSALVYNNDDNNNNNNNNNKKNNNLLAQLYDMKHSYLILIIFW